MSSDNNPSSPHVSMNNPLFVHPRSIHEGSAPANFQQPIDLGNPMFAHHHGSFAVVMKLEETKKLAGLDLCDFYESEQYSRESFSYELHAPNRFSSTDTAFPPNEHQQQQQRKKSSELTVGSSVPGIRRSRATRMLSAFRRSRKLAIT